MKKKNIALIIMGIYSIPVAIFIGIFVSIRQEHNNHPDKAACRTFKAALEELTNLDETSHSIRPLISIQKYTAADPSSTPLINKKAFFTDTETFAQGTAQICRCFIEHNRMGKPQGYVTPHSLDICAKPIVYPWISSDGKNSDNPKEKCFRDLIYREILVPKSVRSVAKLHTGTLISSRRLDDTPRAASYEIKAIYNFCYH